MTKELTNEESLALEEHKCPDCGGKKFLEGPHGGVCVNVECAGCGSRFNIIPGTKGGERIRGPQRKVEV